MENGVRSVYGGTVYVGVRQVYGQCTEGCTAGGACRLINNTPGLHLPGSGGHRLATAGSRKRITSS